ncbi:MAG: phasin family protein [Pseudomonadota bacterium]
MYATHEPFIAFQQANLAAAVEISQVALDGTEKLAQLNLAAAREALNETARTARTALEAKSLQELLALQPATVEPQAEKVLSYLRNVYEIAAETQAAAAKAVEGRVSAFGQALIEQIEKVSRSGPAGSEAAVSFIKSGVAAANSAYDSFSKAAKQVAELAEANVNTATAAVSAAKKKAAKA